MLYTPLDVNDIYPTDKQKMAKRQCVTCKGKTLYVEEKDNGQYELLQLLSTDPNDFMDTRYTPGNYFT
ncbi:MAG TPA: YlzJ-like family protein [Virgibacillus sp.]|nr:YlzJ-like family protein [Virgibacillus sp.]